MSSESIPEGASAVERLIDATLEPFKQFGLTDTTVSIVSELAGLSRGLILAPM